MKSLLLFSDLPGNVVHKYDPRSRKASVHMLNAGFTGPDLWRWGGMSNNGRDKADPRFEVTNESRRITKHAPVGGNVLLTKEFPSLGSTLSLENSYSKRETTIASPRFAPTTGTTSCGCTGIGRRKRTP